jgi:ATP-binding cassette subfamily F protein 3
MRYQIKHAIVRYAADTILEDVNFEIHDKEKIAVVGRNGCGKTTLLKLIAGDIAMDNLDSDEECGIITAGKQEIGYLRQISFTDGEVSVFDEIKKVFNPVFECEKRMSEVEELLKTDVESRKLLAEYADLQKKMEALRGYSWKRDLEVMFQQFGFALEDLERPIGTFSGGQQTKVAFIKLLLSRPDIMLLDEPTNHLDLPTIEWLENYLKNYDKAVVIVSHDRLFLDRITDVTYEIEYHRIKRYPGNYSTFMKLKEENLIKQEKDYEEQQKEIARLTEWIEKWKNTPTKVAAARSKQMAIEHMVKIEKPRRFDTRAFRAMFSPRIESYTNVINAKDLAIGYDSVLSEVTFLLQKGNKMAIIGENGKGKSTLLKTLVGTLESLGGSFTIGNNVEWGYFDQQKAVQDDADPEQTILDNFWEAYPKLVREEVRGALGYILTNFTRDIADMRLALVGYGRIGRALLGYLLALGASPTVYTRRREVALELGGMGINCSVLGQDTDLRGIDLLINTAPAAQIDPLELDPKTKILDLASGNVFPPSESLTKLSSIPDAYYPLTAGRLYAEGILRFLDMEVKL